MQQTSKDILPGVRLTCVTTDKFKGGLISLNLLTRLCRENASANALIPSVLRRGTVRYPDMDALNARLDELYGAVIDPLVRRFGEIQSVGLAAVFTDDAYLPGRNNLLEDVAALLGEMLLSPVMRGGLFLPDYVESEKEKLLEDIRASVNNKTSYALRRLREQMCSMEDFAVDVLGSESAAESIGYVALTRRYHDLLAESPIELFYVGSADFERVAAAMRGALVTLPRGELDEELGTEVRMNALEAEPRFFDEQMDVTQAKLAMGYRLGLCMEEPNLPALRVFNTLFGGGVSSKLFMNVREKLSLCYFASSVLSVEKGVLFVVSGIDADRADRVREEIGVQLAALAAGDFTAEELQTARATVASDMRSVPDGRGALEGYWMTYGLLGFDCPPEEFAALAEAVTADDIIDIANTIELDAVYLLHGADDAAAEEEADE